MKVDGQGTESDLVSNHSSQPAFIITKRRLPERVVLTSERCRDDFRRLGCTCQQLVARLLVLVERLDLGHAERQAAIRATYVTHFSFALCQSMQGFLDTINDGGRSSTPPRTCRAAARQPIQHHHRRHRALHGVVRQGSTRTVARDDASLGPASHCPSHSDINNCDHNY